MRAFIRGLENFEPLVEVAREGLRREGIDERLRMVYVLRLAKTGTSDNIYELVMTGRLGREQTDNPVLTPISAGAIDELAEGFYRRYIVEADRIDVRIQTLLRSAELEAAVQLMHDKRAYEGSSAVQALEILRSERVQSGNGQYALRLVIIETGHPQLIDEVEGMEEHEPGGYS